MRNSIRINTIRVLTRITKVTHFLIGGTLTMAMKRTSLHLDDRDLQLLERIAREETETTGTRVSASAIVRRLIREYLRSRGYRR